MKYYPRELMEYLRFFGEARFEMGNFSKEDFNFTTVILVTNEKIADGLVREVNQQLPAEDGNRAFFRLLATNDLENGRYRYAAEIVPYSYIPRNEWEDATNEFLARLPKVLKNFRKKHHSRRR